MKAVLPVLFAALLCAPALAQVELAEPPDRPQPRIGDGVPDLPPPGLIPDAEPAPDTAPDAPSPDAVDPAPIPELPDYSTLSSTAERTARLDEMFARLGAAETESAGKLIAEEIWSVWLDSGSPSVNFVLRRGADAQVKNRPVEARVMFDHVTRLEPDYAEGWARSSRLALTERDFARAVTEALIALSYEPRHFYALWTLGNVMEQLGRQEEALEAYRAANEVHPRLKAVSDRVDALQIDVEGSVL